ncbi:probable E3 ubiquitin-protein ligase RNF217 [Tanacetum coccineum]
MWSSLYSMCNMILRRQLISKNPTRATLDPLQEKKCPYSIRIASPNSQLMKSQNPSLDLVQQGQEEILMWKAIPMIQLKSQNPYQDQVEQAVQVEETIMCEICVEQVRLNSIFKNGHKCAHRFCTNCMSRYIQGKIDDNVSDITCPATTCSRPLDPLSCRPRLTYQLFNKWCDKLCEAAVSLVERVYCPNIECSELILSECDDNPKRCECPSCKQPFCFECQKKWRRCPKCRHVVERVGGCNLIRCRLTNLKWLLDVESIFATGVGVTLACAAVSVTGFEQEYSQYTQWTDVIAVLHNSSDQNKRL